MIAPGEFRCKLIHVLYFEDVDELRDEAFKPHKNEFL